MTNLQIVPFASAHLPDVTRLVNEQIAPVVPHWQLTEAQTAAILAKDSLWEVHYADEEPPPWRWENEIVCVVDGTGRVNAAARLDYRYDDGPLAQVEARWLVADEQQPQALSALLDHLTAKRVNSHTRIAVNGRSDFSAGWGGVPTSSLHITAALTEKGFVAPQKWVIMTANISQWADAPLAPLPATLTPRWMLDDTRRERNLSLYDGETLAGECQSWGIPPELATCAGADGWMQIEWLGVETPYQRQGLGRWLLQSQLRHHAQRGITHCLLYTEVHNTPSRQLNTVLGFHDDAEVWGWSI